MIFGKSKLELNVGFFVFIGLAILITFILMIGDFKTWGSGYNINFIFNFVNGVKVGAPVRYAGVDIGEVKNIEFITLSADKKTKVKIISWIRDSVEIPSDSEVWVNTLGLLGEKYIEIIPGSDYSKFVKPNDSMRGVDPIAMHEVMGVAKKITQDLDELIAKVKDGDGTVGRLLNDDSIYNEIQNLIKEIESLVQDIKRNPWRLFWKTKERPEKK